MRVALSGVGQLGSDIVHTKPEAVELYPLTRADMDITEAEQINSVLKSVRPDVLINTASYVRVDDAEDNPEEAFLVNAIGVKNLAHACKSLGTVFLHLSTDYVFDGSKTSPYLESDLPFPINTYGLSKYAGEIYIRSELQKYYIVRVASLYGKAGASGKGGNFVYTILRKGREGQKLKVIDDMFMSPTYTLDAARNIWELVSGHAPYGIYHATNSGHCSWYEFAKAILEIAGIKTEITPVPHTEYTTRAKRPLWSVLGSEKGVRMRHWREGLQDFIKGLK